MRRFLPLLPALCAALLSCQPSADAILADLPDDATEALVVDNASGSHARVTLFVRRSAGGRWRRGFSCHARIGRNGLGKTAEGDGKTPCGVFRATGAFGVKPCPKPCAKSSSAGRLPYLRLTSSTFACDEPCEYYNRIIDTAAVHHDCHGEDMSRIVPAYNYGLTIDYNPGCVYPLGSNIFVHCFSPAPRASNRACRKEYNAGSRGVSAGRGGHSAGLFGVPADRGGHSAGLFGVPADRGGHLAGLFGVPADRGGHSAGLFGVPADRGGHSAGLFGVPADRAKPTAGCIALPERRMRRLVRLASPGTVIVIPGK